MTTKLDLYRIFAMVAEQNGFSKAGVKLHMSQSAVSQAIKQLEEELDTHLFYRTKKGAALTKEGETMYEYVQSALQLFYAGEQALHKMKQLETGELKMGVGDAIMKHLLLPFLEAFHREYPMLKFKVINGTTYELIHLLKASEIDLAICHLPIEENAIESHPLYDVQDTFVCGPKDKNEFQEPVDLERLIDYPIISFESKSHSRHYVQRFLKSKGVLLEPAFELGSYELLVEFAKLNLGIASVVREFAHQAIQDQDVFEIPLNTPIPKRSVGICYLKSVPLSMASLTFVEFLQKHKTIERTS
ncbi:DNA-binding transcriptional regulator, LysR family [Pelagirhabdus alkalitolerans]|uniref:DNA-binding transcriptional regulator, LysR family n=1 Tax=Pelagirhabdus alkalitolerans TaxID=1612202 RepID=A0A1G6GMX8_9BACI|nr:LysR family transcriptional regulator [Pelagirhabdus alkalitolerans]SDB83347.1 DNA-binding transcriptional regulator, LysR family [Pelagirhabdus alkalitolerans]